MKVFLRTMSLFILSIGWMTANAQGSLTVDQLSRASQQRQQQNGQPQRGQVQQANYSQTDCQPFSLLYVEYSPTQLHVSYHGVSDNTNYHGIALGYSYFYPFAGSLGVDAGIKAQYFFRNETKGAVKYKNNMFSATIPIDLAYDWHATDGLAVYPYAGLYARFNFSANSKEEGNGYSHKYNVFDKDDMGDHTWDRFQVGWQAGVNFRIMDVFTIGGGYFMDLTKITDHTTVRGFNIRAGVNF